MSRFRHLSHMHPAIGIALILLALAARMFVPTGYMPGNAHGSITVELCSGMSGQSMQVALPALPDKGDTHKGMKDAPCAFSGLATPSLAGADPVLLALAILFATAIVRHVVAAPLIAASAHLRPPLRGPPATA